jgi:hypothetical protein
LHYIHDGAVKTKKWLILDVHDDVEAEMEKLLRALPGLCADVAARRSNNVAEALCYAYRESRRLVEQFVSEPILPREAARRALWRGRAKRWGLVGASLAVGLAGLAAGHATALFALVVSAALSLWRPSEYVIAMRNGVTCVEPRRYVPALKC